MADSETGAILNGEVYKPNPNWLSIYIHYCRITFKNILGVDERPRAYLTQFKRP